MEFVRGDSFPFKIKVTKNDGSILKKEEVDTIFVTCRQLPYKEMPILFQKNIDDVTIDEESYLHIMFDPENTEQLDYGKYYFDIEITLKNGYRKTKLDVFTITQETTIYNGE